MLAGGSLAVAADGSGEDALYHNQKGVEYFSKAFHEHTPKRQAQEAERNYALAAAEFKKALSIDPSSVDAHRNLARLYYIQTNFTGAVQEYQKVTQLDSKDLDAYVNLALAYIQLAQYNSAIEVLQEAKTHTTDQKAREKLDTYIDKVRQHQ
jgi:tetratricopeptide (TPR) repeat protein